MYKIHSSQILRAHISSLLIILSRECLKRYLSRKSWVEVTLLSASNNPYSLLRTNLFGSFTSPDYFSKSRGLLFLGCQVSCFLSMMLWSWVQRCMNYGMELRQAILWCCERRDYELETWESPVSPHVSPGITLPMQETQDVLISDMGLGLLWWHNASFFFSQQKTERRMKV